MSEGLALVTLLLFERGWEAAPSFPAENEHFIRPMLRYDAKGAVLTSYSLLVTCPSVTIFTIADQVRDEIEKYDAVPKEVGRFTSEVGSNGVEKPNLWPLAVSDIGNALDAGKFMIGFVSPMRISHDGDLLARPPLLISPSYPGYVIDHRFVP